MAPLPDITFYYFPLACSQAVHIVLHELAIPFKAVSTRHNSDRKLEAADGSLTAEEYRDQVHHSNYVPGFVVTFPDGNKESITETPAILSYLASLVPERNLGGKTELEKAKVLSWIMWIGGTLQGTAYSAFLAPRRFVDASDEKLKEGVQAGGRRNIEAGYDHIEKHLQKPGSGWLVGQDVTLADAYAYVIYRWGIRLAGYDMEKYKKYTEFARRLEGRESVKKALEDEGVPAHFN
ncbi:glutathione S-transferase [Triangularia verruculosa]|uniref:Glutathione S-transferase n=1 Tax=Triangularia verruculosa TaxID=2587418 RepID=A0AAN6XKL7_9PEZI|nr:glutathione S-transferase [Triangularia verruculosa]